MIGYDEALAIVARAAAPLGRETVALADAHRRTLAEPVIAQVDWPPADVSAMDGYAVRDSELAGGRRSFAVVGESFPGAPFAGGTAPGSCVRIFTGAAVPAGLDRVVIQEIVRRDGDVASIDGETSPARHIRKRGSDFAAGATLLDAGRLLEARALVAAAGADLAELSVWRRPRLALLGTGDELAEPGTARMTPGNIPESLSAGIAALAVDWGGTVVGQQRVRDDPARIEAAAGAALEAADLVVMTGGASVGDKDFAKASFEAHGLELLFSKVAIKPGKPVWFGRARQRLVLGLPGNPSSAMVTARLLLAPLLAGLCGRDPMSAVRWRSVGLEGELGPVGDRESFVRGRWAGDCVSPMGDQDSGAQKVLADAELLIRRRAGVGPAKDGEMVEVVEF